MKVMDGQEVRSQEAKVRYRQPHGVTIVQRDDLGGVRRAQGSRQWIKRPGKQQGSKKRDEMPVRTTLLQGSEKQLLSGKTRHGYTPTEVAR